MNPATPGRSEPSRPAWAALLILLVVLSRVPLLTGGYGSDPDAWRNVAAAIRMREVGGYVPSRPPGFPLHEGLLVLLAPLGPLATNGASALAGCLAVGLFWRTARRLGLRGRGWLVAAFAFGPALWVETTQTMDYAFALTALLAAHEATLRGRPRAAGVLLGLGVGFRAGLAPLVLPMLLHLWTMGGRRALLFAVAFAVTCATVYVPTSLQVGGNTLGGYFLAQAATHHVTWSSLPELSREAALFLFGKPGTIVLAAAVLGAAIAHLVPRIRSRGLRDRVPPPHGGTAGVASPVRLEAGIVAAVLLLHLLIPLQAAYLLPALPAGLFLCARALPGALLAAVSLAILTASLATPYLDAARLGPGRVAIERGIRRRDLAVAHELMRRPTPGPTVFVVGRPRLLHLMLLEPSLLRTDAAWPPHYASGVALWSRDHQRGFAATLDAEADRALRQQGYSITEEPPPDAW